MADKVISYGASEGFGAFAGWESHGTEDATNLTRAIATDDKGDEVASDLHDERREVSGNYECNNDTNTIPADIGDLVNSLILTSLNISTAEGRAATMALTGHNHTNNAHADLPALRKAAHAITLAKCFGATDFMGGTAGDNASCIEGSVNITCEHVDQNDGDGDHLVGENYGAKIEARSVWAGVPSVVAEAGWDVTVETTTDENTGFQKTTVTGVKSLPMA